MMYWTPPAAPLPPLLDSILLLLQPVRGRQVGALIEAGPHGDRFCSVNKREGEMFAGEINAVRWRDEARLGFSISRTF